jgi:hypothetical protein
MKLQDCNFPMEIFVPRPGFAFSRMPFYLDILPRPLKFHHYPISGCF